MISKSNIGQFAKQNGAWIGFFCLAIFLAIWTDGQFLSSRNLSNLVRQASLNGILAAGMTMVILTGGIDLSIGSLVALCGVAVGISQVQLGWGEMGTTGLMMSFGLAIVSGLVLGLTNGVLISRLKLAPFVITLGMMVIARGLSLIFAGGSTISPMSESLNNLASGFIDPGLSLIPVVLIALGFAYGIFKKTISISAAIFPVLAFAFFATAFLNERGIPYLAVFLICTITLTWFLLNRTVFGRNIYAIGSNEKAAYWAGVSIAKSKTWVYGLMGLLAGLAAVLLTGRLNSADPNAGQLFELDAIAAVVIGGVSLKGGRGSVFGALIGALTMATLSNGMDLMGVSSFYQMVLKGFVIILAVSLDRNQRE